MTRTLKIALLSGTALLGAVSLAVADDDGHEGARPGGGGAATWAPCPDAPDRLCQLGRGGGGDDDEGGDDDDDDDDDGGAAPRPTGPAVPKNPLIGGSRAVTN